MPSPSGPIMIRFPKGVRVPKENKKAQPKPKTGKGRKRK